MKTEKLLYLLGVIETGDVFTMRETIYGLCDVGSDYYYESYTKDEINDIVDKRWSKNNIAVARVYSDNDYVYFEIYDKKGNFINELTLEFGDISDAEYFKKTFKIPKHMKRRLEERLEE